MKCLEVYYEFPHSPWFLNHYFHHVCNLLVEKNTDIKFDIVNVGQCSPRDPNTINSAHIMTIRNPENKKYILISFWDKNSILFNRKVWDTENMVQLITSSGFNIKEFYFNKLHLRNVDMYYPDNIDEIYTPFTYNVYSTRIAEFIENCYEQRKNTSTFDDKIIFRGAMYNERAFLKDNLVLDNVLLSEQRIDDSLYLEEQIKNICSLSLNGAAEICNRDIELFGLGMPVLRNKLNVQFHNELKPDYHYISIGECGFRESFTQVNYGDLMSSIINRVNEIPSKRDYYLSVGDNARKWYTENCTMDAMLKMIEKALKLDKLF